MINTYNNDNSQRARKIADRFSERDVTMMLPHVLTALSRKGTYGYEAQKEIRKLFGVSLGPSIVYPGFDAFEKQKILTSTVGIYNGRLRKVYNANEPLASEVMKAFFDAEERMHSGVQKLRKIFEGEIYIDVCLPSTISWGNRCGARPRDMA